MLTLLPIITIIPIVIQCIQGLHLGGLNTLWNFLLSALTPSLSNDVVATCLHGLQITFAYAIISWLISISAGLILAFLSSYSINKIIGIPEIFTNIIRGILTLPRATHELIWGLLLLQIFGLAPWIAITAISIPYSSLMARVFAEQIDKIDLSNAIALKQVGSSKLQILISTFLPKLIPIVGIYGSYRLECAIRGATLLGVFGLGGIGTEMQLSILSLKFNEMWTSIWMLFISILILEKILEFLQKPTLYIKNIGIYTLTSIILLSCSFGLSLIWLNGLGVNLFQQINVYLFKLPSLTNLLSALIVLPWAKLLSETILLMILASGIAIGLPPLLLMILPNQFCANIFSVLWIFCRLIPTPLTTMLLLLSINPSISVAALALGIQNMGVLGRLLKQNIDKQDNKLYTAILATGSKPQLAWLYGKNVLTKQ